MGALNMDQKKEIIYNSYSITLDIELAYKKADVTDAEIDKIEADDEFQYRLAIAEAEVKEDLIKKLNNIAESSKVNPKTQLTAIVELGNVLYGDRFSKTKKPSDGDEPAILNLYLPDNGRSSKKSKG